MSNYLGLGGEGVCDRYWDWQFNLRLLGVDYSYVFRFSVQSAIVIMFDLNRRVSIGSHRHLNLKNCL